MDDPRLDELFADLAKLPFRTTKRYDPPHQYVMTHSIPSGLAIWHRVRLLSREHGVIRPFYKSRAVWKYLDSPDGWTYWIMPQWLTDDWETGFDPLDNYVINRQPTRVAKDGEWARG